VPHGKSDYCAHRYRSFLFIKRRVINRRAVGTEDSRMLSLTSSACCNFLVRCFERDPLCRERDAEIEIIREAFRVHHESVARLEGNLDGRFLTHPQNIPA
jgi:hypothetical protein